MVGISGIMSGPERGIWGYGLWEGAHTRDCIPSGSLQPQLSTVLAQGSRSVPGFLSAELQANPAFRGEDVYHVSCFTGCPLGPLGASFFPYVVGEL